jgi:hypothetical protein
MKQKGKTQKGHDKGSNRNNSENSREEEQKRNNSFIHG